MLARDASAPSLRPFPVRISVLLAGELQRHGVPNLLIDARAEALLFRREGGYLNPP